MTIKINTYYYTNININFYLITYKNKPVYLLKANLQLCVFEIRKKMVLLNTRNA